MAPVAAPPALGTATGRPVVGPGSNPGAGVDAEVDDDSPTMAIPTGGAVAGGPPAAKAPSTPQATTAPATPQARDTTGATDALALKIPEAPEARPGYRPVGQAASPPAPPPRLPRTDAEDSPLAELQRVVRSQQPDGRHNRKDLVWQPRFAYTSALVIFVAFAVVSLPLWLVLYRIGESSANKGTGPQVADLVALSMMLMGGILTGAAAWVIIIEMRGRVRMVDTLARTGEREVMIAPAAPEIPVLDAPLDRLMFAEPVASTRGPKTPDDPVGWDRATLAARVARAQAQQAGVAATLEASSKLLSSFSSVLKSFGQLPAQVAMLAVALALFVGATVLSLD